MVGFIGVVTVRIIGQWNLWYLEGLRAFSSILATLGTLTSRGYDVGGGGLTLGKLIVHWLM